MSFPKNIWNQLKGITVRELVAALQIDGFVPDDELRTERIYRHPDGRRISIHYHKGSNCYKKGMLTALLDDIDWSLDDLRRLKLIK